MNKPLISIIMPVYNRKKAFLEALLSIKGQSYPNVEIIVIDDGSTEFNLLEETLPIDAHVERQKNKGAQAARNAGLAHAKGEYIIFWDADVVAKPEMLSEMYAALQSSDATFAYSSFYWGKKKFASQEFDSAQLQKENYIHMTALILRECISELDESITKFQDWDTWLTMLEQGGHGKYIPKYLFSIITGGTISSWLPSFCYKAPFKWIPGISSRVKKYEHGKMLIQKKHSLSS